VGSADAAVTPTADVPMAADLPVADWPVVAADPAVSAVKTSVVPADRGVLPVCERFAGDRAVMNRRD
jgi:hypothetical protein